MSKAYDTIVRSLESRLDQHGDNHLGVGWPNAVDADTRYRIHLELLKWAGSSGPVRLLDLGCGASHLHEYMLRNHIEGVAYSGLDLSERFIELSRAKYPDITYYCIDILDDPQSLPHFDYIIMNGVLTQKMDLPFETMLEYAKKLIQAAFQHADIGLSFNVMSKYVDWERDDLFHLPIDTLASFLVSDISRNFVIRNDYRLYEYTAYVYR